MAIVSEILETAKAWRAAGFSILPIGPNKKTTLSSWGRFQNEIPSEAYLDAWFGDNPGLALVCGKVSGNLEMLELEDRAITPENLARINAGMREAGVEEVWDDLQVDHYFQQSPSGGVHFLYRILDNPVPGNTPVARRPSTPQELEQNPGKFKVLAETRGEGGYFIIAPSGGPVHPSGRPWVALAGTPGDVKNLTWDERNAIHAVIYGVLDEMPPAPAWEPKQYETYNSDELRPGDDFNNRARWDDILEPEGWTRFPRPGSRGETLWTRPGKRASQGASASTGYTNDGDRLYVFSSSTEFETERPYDKFSAFALIRHRGDLAAAASALRKLGYGSPRVSAPVSNPAPKGWTPVFDGMVVDPASAQKVPNAKAAMTNELPSPTNSYEVAQVLAGRIPSSDGMPHWAWWQGQWYRWNGAHWKVYADSMVTKWTYEQTGNAMYIGSKGEPMKWTANQKNIGSVVHGLGQGLLQRDHDLEPDSDGIFCANGALKLGSRELEAPSPRRFNLNSLPYDYDSQAQCPQWMKFLEEVLPGDTEAQEFLQEWFGYVLSGRTDLQKMASLVGAKRSGKGTIGRILTALVGQESMAGPTLERLGSQFGEQCLIGKSLAIMSDVKWNLRAATEAVPNLLATIGEDSRSIPRKNLADWNGLLGVRFMTMSNDSPKFSDASGALAGRMIHVRFRVSFFGRENPGLTSELLTELPGILNWALDGLDRLSGRGRFTEPASGDSVAEEVEENSAPVKTFVSDCAELVETSEIGVDELYNAYFAWCRSQGWEHVPSKIAMSRDLMSAYADRGVRIERVRVGSGSGSGSRTRVVRGLRLQDWVKEDSRYGLTWITGHQSYRGQDH